MDLSWVEQEMGWKISEDWSKDLWQLVSEDRIGEEVEEEVLCGGGGVLCGGGSVAGDERV